MYVLPMLEQALCAQWEDFELISSRLYRIICKLAFLILSAFLSLSLSLSGEQLSECLSVVIKLRL